MLRCEISVPALTRSYEFSVNEHVRVPALIEEVMSVIETREGCRWEKGADGAILCDVERGRVLPRERTLYECHVTQGSKLMLI